MANKIGKNSQNSMDKNFTNCNPIKLVNSFFLFESNTIEVALTIKPLKKRQIPSSLIFFIYQKSFIQLIAYCCSKNYMISIGGLPFEANMIRII